MFGEGNGNPLQYSHLGNPWMGEPGGLKSTGSQRVGHDWAISLHFNLMLQITYTYDKIAKTEYLSNLPQIPKLALIHKMT